MSPGQGSPLPFTSLSAVLLVDDLFVAELSDGSVEFHVDCLAQGLSGDLFKIGIYDCEKSPEKIAALRRLLQPGSLVEIRDEAVDYCEGSWRLMGPLLYPYAGDLAAARAEFARSRSRQEKAGEEPSAPDCVRGRVVACRVLETKNAGPMAFAKVETMGETIEAIFYPEDFQRFKELLDVPDELFLYGTLDVSAENQEKKILVNDVRR